MFYYWISTATSCLGNTLALTKSKVEVIKYNVQLKQGNQTSARRQGWDAVPRSLSTFVSLTKLGAAPPGTSPPRSFLLPLLCLSSSLLSSLPALLSTRGLCNALFTKDVSRGTWLSPLGVFRCLVVCECVCVCHEQLSSVCTSSVLPVGIWALGEECMIQDCFPWEQTHFPSYFVISGSARRRICHLQCGSVRSVRKEEVRHNKHVQ